MSTAPPGTAADPEAAYYQTIEEHFVSRRGDPLFLSNADWLLIRGWRQAGIPLRVVLRGITDALDSHAHSWSRERKVGSLAYCAGEVEASRQRWERALTLGPEAGVRPEAFLLELADAAERSSTLGPRGRVMAVRLGAELRARAGQADTDSLADLEAWLNGLEKALVEVIRAEIPADRLARLEAAVDGDLLAYRDRMPAKILDQVRGESITRRLLEAHGLLRFSLFHLA